MTVLALSCEEISGKVYFVTSMKFGPVKYLTPLTLLRAVLGSKEYICADGAAECNIQVVAPFHAPRMAITATAKHASEVDNERIMKQKRERKTTSDGVAMIGSVEASKSARMRSGVVFRLSVKAT